MTIAEARKILRGAASQLREHAHEIARGHKGADGKWHHEENFVKEAHDAHDLNLRTARQLTAMQRGVLKIVNWQRCIKSLHVPRKKKL